MPHISTIPDPYMPSIYRRMMTFGKPLNPGFMTLGHPISEKRGKREMSFGATSGDVGQQGTNSGSVAVESQSNGRK